MRYGILWPFVTVESGGLNLLCHMKYALLYKVVTLAWGKGRGLKSCDYLFLAKRERGVQTNNKLSVTSFKGGPQDVAY